MKVFIFRPEMDDGTSSSKVNVHKSLLAVFLLPPQTLREGLFVKLWKSLGSDLIGCLFSPSVQTCLSSIPSHPRAGRGPDLARIPARLRLISSGVLGGVSLPIFFSSCFGRLILFWSPVTWFVTLLFHESSAAAPSFAADVLAVIRRREAFKGNLL